MLSRLKQLTLAAAGVAALALGGSALAGAASTTSPTPAATSTTSSSSTTREGPGHAFPAGEAPGTTAHESSEAAVTGADASKAQAAVKSVPGTAGAVTSNFTKDGYEVTVTKSDGSKVIVHVDSSFQVDQGRGTH